MNQKLKLYVWKSGYGGGRWCFQLGEPGRRRPGELQSGELVFKIQIARSYGEAIQRGLADLDHKQHGLAVA